MRLDNIKDTNLATWDIIIRIADEYEGDQVGFKVEEIEDVFSEDKA